MKRKTNLFYLGATQDNNFLSLSNYSESLTGNLLSTDNKIFPSSFLCMNLSMLRDEEKAKEFYDKKYEPIPPSLDNDNNEHKEWDELEGYEKKSIIYEMNKELFINGLVSYYENKMATLRDWCISNNYNQEKMLLPLNYLLEYIYKYENMTEEEVRANSKIVYYGNVTEQDYNGTFTDTICVVDPTKERYTEIMFNNHDGAMYATLEGESTRYLHGWSDKLLQYDPNYDFNKDGAITLSLYKSDENKLLSDASADWVSVSSDYNFVSNDLSDDLNEYYRLCKKEEIAPDEEVAKHIIELAKYEEGYHGPSEYEELSPIYDKMTDTAIEGMKIPEYEITSIIDGLKITNKDNYDAHELTFNVMIPLYDIIDTNYMTDEKNIDETIDAISLAFNKTNPEQMIQNVPLGIWFSGPTDVTLTMDRESGCGTTWSLSIANQFKPFPVSDKMPSEITDDSKKDAFMTFASLLTQQSELVVKMSDMMRDMKSMSERLSNVESAIGSVLTSYNLDEFREDMTKFKQETNDKISELIERISELDLKWVNKEG